MLELEDLTFAYPDQRTPFGFSLRVAPGEIVAVTGISGSGKSTLLDLIAGFLTPTGGTVTLDGVSLAETGPEARPVSILFQDDNLFDHLDVKTNLELGLPRGTPGPEAAGAVETALAQVGMSDFADRSARKLSGGQKQRVALARTLLRSRPVLLLDEPFANLDTGTAADMRDLVRRLTGENGWHVVVVSHLPEDAAELADRRYELRDNRLYEEPDSSEPSSPSAEAD